MALYRCVWSKFDSESPLVWSFKESGFIIQNGKSKSNPNMNSKALQQTKITSEDKFSARLLFLVKIESWNCSFANSNLFRL